MPHGYFDGPAADAMTAFQRRRATMVVPVTTSVQTFLPIVLEPFFLREHLSAAVYGGAPIAGGLLIAFVGTTLLSSTDVVADLTSGAQGSRYPADVG